MIILLTGKPGVGKSTLIKKVIDSYKDPMLWVMTHELLTEKGNRVGFQANNSKGQIETVSHKTNIQSAAVIGQNAVDLNAVDRMFGRILNEAISFNGLTIVDEIGPIQLLSSKFAEALSDAFSHSGQVNLISTIHYNDERLEEFRISKDAWLFKVDETNRDVLTRLVILCAQHMETINNLSKKQKDQTFTLLNKYIDGAKLIQVEKLLNNAIHYATNGSVKKSDANWKIDGKHGSYVVQKNDSDYSCTCDLYNGRGMYTNNGGECSHIQAVGMISL